MGNDFIDADRRLVMRYEHANTFTLRKVRVNAANEAVYNLAGAIASVQTVRPMRITSVAVQHLSLV